MKGIFGQEFNSPQLHHYVYLSLKNNDFFKLVKGSKKWIFFLFFGSIMAHLSSLLIPVFTSNIIYEVTNGNANATYLNICLLSITYISYNLLWYLNYTSYSHNFKYSYKNLREKIIVLNKGKIVGQGSHKELMKDNEYYINLQTNNCSSSHKKTEESIISNENITEQK